MAESSPKWLTTLWEKEKLLVMSNFSFSHSVFKRPVLLTRKNQSLFGKVLRKLPESMVRCKGRHDITEMLLKMALNTIQSISLTGCLLWWLLPQLQSIYTRHVYSGLDKPLGLNTHSEVLLFSNS